MGGVTRLVRRHVIVRCTTVLRIPGELEKGNRDRELPITPDFAEFLLRTSPEQRRGRVFKLPGKYGTPQPRWVSELVSRFGKAARIKVHVHPRTGKVKYASAHDLRRSFGTRWAPRVMPTVLMELMRHESIQTTMDYYIGQGVQATAEVIWKAYGKATSGNTPGNTCRNSPDAVTERLPQHTSK